jgi:hypothetical protein
MFSIAGPVIVYGCGSSFLYGLIIYIFKLYWFVGQKKFAQFVTYYKLLNFSKLCLTKQPF